MAKEVMLLTPEAKENAAPCPSVGADVGQQLSNIRNNNISNPGAESNENLLGSWGILDSP